MTDDPKHLVLIAEDDPDVRTLLSRAIGTVATVEVAENGLEAWERLQNEPTPRLIITDLMMPKMDGLELLRKLKKNDRLSKVPVLVLTAKDTPRDHVAAIRGGARGYITKPFKPLQLIEKVKSTLGIK